MNLPHTWERAYKLALLFSEDVVNTFTIDELQFITTIRVGLDPGTASVYLRLVYELDSIMEIAFHKLVGRSPFMAKFKKGMAQADIAQADQEFCQQARNIAQHNGYQVAAIKAERDQPRQPRTIRVREDQMIYFVHHRTGYTIGGVTAGRLRFNFQEWRAYHMTSELPDEIDSNDLGYWWKDKGKMHYTKPDAKWRKLMVMLEGVI